MPASDSTIRQQFRQLLDAMQKVDAIYLSEQRHITSEDDIAEGYRNLLHILKRGVDLFMEVDPARPVFKRLQRTDCKTQGDCPDTIYYHTRIAPNAELVIRGRKTSEAYLSFTVYDSSDRIWSDGVGSEINHHAMRFDDDGNYEIRISPTPQEGNWLQSGGSSDQVVVRQYFEHPHPAGNDLQLEQYRPIISWDESKAPPATRFDAERIGTSLERMATYLEQMTYGRVDIGGAGQPRWFSLVPNTIGAPEIWQPSHGGGNGAPDVAYAAGFFQLEPGQALVIRGRFPPCDYASITLTNRFLQSLDYCENPIVLNRSNMDIAEDGSFTAIVSEHPPGRGNWLCSEGRRSGIIYVRFMTPTGTLAPLETEVIATEAASHA